MIKTHNLLILLTTFISLVACNSASVKTNNESSTSKSNPSTSSNTSKNLNAREMAGELNKHRNALGLPQLQWSESLASYANEWATHLQSKGCKLIHRPIAGKSKQRYGENLFYAGPVRWSTGVTELQKINAKTVSDKWVSEKVNYSHQSNSCKAGKVCTHYTQVVWKKSTEVGCAAAVCANKSQVVVCNFSPAGNIVGQRPY